uniref:Ring finger protein 40 n=1 Tax=Nothobranchius kuhntae TaxID=321403 RepID=A0A1A8I9P0_NOTKU
MGPKKSAAEAETPAGTKRSRPQDSPEASSPRKDILELLDSIDKRLLGFEGRLHLLEVLHQEFQNLRQSLEFSQEQVERLAAENASLRESVSSLEEGMTRITQDNKTLKETVLDLQARSMRDNLEFAGLPEQTGGAENCEHTIKNFLQTEMKIPEETIKNITFHRVHRLGAKRGDSRRPRPIVAKFEHFKQKDLVKSHGRELKGKDFSVNDQFPKEILDRRRVLFPLRKKFIQDGKRAVISVDKLYVDNKLYKERGVTDWLY